MLKRKYRKFRFRLKRLDSSYKLIEFLSGRRNNADTVVNVAMIEFRLGAVVLIEKFVFSAAYEKIGVAAWVPVTRLICL